MSNIIFFKDRLKKLRKEYNFTQQDLSSKLGIVRTAIANYETGRTSPDLETLKLIAQIFDTSTDYLLGRTDLKNPVNTYANKKDIDYAAESKKPYLTEYKEPLDIQSLSLKNQERISEYIKIIKLLEDNHLDIEKED